MKEHVSYLSKREQQIMEIVYRRGQVTANELTAELPGNPSNSTVRTLLRILEEKGQLSHSVENGRFVYHPTEPGQTAAKTELSKIVRLFFRGSVSQTVAALIQESEAKLSQDELSELESLIAKAKREGR